ncbi:MAG: hypothetical protein ABS35_42680 [Kaistia sp. SCN 65-12]|nr:MAG: hypothetical protein ABS35_42680 [Kaistia sp. SCN 65-12]
MAVIGLPDATAGQRVHAVAVPASEACSPPDVLAAIADKLPAYMLPRDIELVPMLPTTPNGKVDYPHLLRERSA